MTNKNFTHTQICSWRTQKFYGATEKNDGATEKFYGAIEKFYGATEKNDGVSEKFYDATEKSYGATGKSNWVSVKNVMDFSKMLNELKNYINTFFLLCQKNGEDGSTRIQSGT